MQRPSVRLKAMGLGSSTVFHTRLTQLPQARLSGATRRGRTDHGVIAAGLSWSRQGRQLPVRDSGRWAPISMAPEVSDQNRDVSHDMFSSHDKTHPTLMCVSNIHGHLLC